MGYIMPRKHFTCGIYTITTPNNSVYVGSSAKIEQRFSEHRSLLKYNKHYSIKLQRAYNKHGDGLKFEIIHECKLSELNKKEQEYINKLNAKLNTTKFVNNVWTNDETRRKLTEIHKSKKWKEERSRIAKNISTRWRTVECSNGEIYKNLTDAAVAFGRRASFIKRLVKTHQKCTLGVKFKYADEEWKPETIAKYRAAEARKKNGNTTYSEESKEKMRKAKIGYKPSQKTILASIIVNTIPIYGISLKDNGRVEYASTKEAALNHYKTSVEGARSGIYRCISGRRKSAYGYKWYKSKQKQEATV